MPVPSFFFSHPNIFFYNLTCLNIILLFTYCIATKFQVYIVEKKNKYKKNISVLLLIIFSLMSQSDTCHYQWTDCDTENYLISRKM